MGHAQPPTPAVKKSATGDVFVNNNICQQFSRAIDIRFYWVRDRVRQGQFLVYCMAGEHNMPYYLNKHHPTRQYQEKKSTHLFTTMETNYNAFYISPTDLRGCVKAPPTWKTDDGQKKTPSSMGRKCMTDGRRQTGLLGIHNIGRDNIVLMAPLI